MIHKVCGGHFQQWLAGGYYCYFQCRKCGYLLGNQDGKVSREIRRAVGNCHNLCCRPHLI